MRTQSMRERRIATQPHYKQSAERDYLLATLSTFVVGAMLGAVIGLGAITSGLVVL